MNEVLRKYIAEILATEMNSPRAPNQLIPPKSKRKSKDSEKEKKSKEEEVDEMSVVGGIAGFTGPLGAGAEDMGEDPVSPGGKLKKKKKNFVRWK